MGFETSGNAENTIIDKTFSIGLGIAGTKITVSGIDNNYMELYFQNGTHLVQYYIHLDNITEQFFLPTAGEDVPIVQLDSSSIAGLALLVSPMLMLFNVFFCIILQL